MVVYSVKFIGKYTSKPVLLLFNVAELENYAYFLTPGQLMADPILLYFN